ncbi:MAG: DNA polymerase III subunit beta [Candidatus Sungbacteria bacterium]|nr:DNA polymerase III subunit beta [Candidatus Sungbacteria bacterium]
MKIICTRNNLRNTFQLVERFTGKSLTLPILGSIFFEADEKKIRCVATNLEVGIEVVMPGKVIRGGSVAIPGRIANTLVQSLDEENVLLEEKDGAITIKTDSSSFTLQGLSPKDFPPLPKIKREHEFSIPANILKKGLVQVLPAVSVSDFKPELSGVYLKRDARAVTLAATDSFRLAEKLFQLQTPGDAVSCIIPWKTCQELSRILPEDGEEYVTVRQGENQVMFDFSEVHMVSRLIDGTYPDYVSIIPKDFSSHLAVPREDLVKRVRAASVLSSKLNDIVLSSSEDEVFIETANSELGKSRIRLLTKGRGKETKVSFNFRYLSDGLEAIDGEEALISLNGDSSPALVSSSQDQSFRYILMPIRSV